MEKNVGLRAIWESADKTCIQAMKDCSNPDHQRNSETSSEENEDSDSFNSSIISCPYTALPQEFRPRKSKPSLKPNSFLDWQSVWRPEENDHKARGFQNFSTKDGIYANVENVDNFAVNEEKETFVKQNSHILHQEYGKDRNNVGAIGDHKTSLLLQDEQNISFQPLLKNLASAKKCGNVECDKSAREFSGIVGVTGESSAVAAKSNPSSISFGHSTLIFDCPLEESSAVVTTSENELGEIGATSLTNLRKKDISKSKEYKEPGIGHFSLDYCEIKRSGCSNVAPISLDEDIIGNHKRQYCIFDGSSAVDSGLQKDCCLNIVKQSSNLEDSTAESIFKMKDPVSAINHGCLKHRRSKKEIEANTDQNYSYLNIYAQCQNQGNEIVNQNHNSLPYSRNNLILDNEVGIIVEEEPYSLKSMTHDMLTASNAHFNCSSCDSVHPVENSDSARCHESTRPRSPDFSNVLGTKRELQDHKTSLDFRIHSGRIKCDHSKLNPKFNIKDLCVKPIESDCNALCERTPGADLHTSNTLFRYKTRYTNEKEQVPFFRVRRCSTSSSFSDDDSESGIMYKYVSPYKAGARHAKISNPYQAQGILSDSAEEGKRIKKHLTFQQDVSDNDLKIRQRSRIKKTVEVKVSEISSRKNGGYKVTEKSLKLKETTISSPKSGKPMKKNTGNTIKWDSRAIQMNERFNSSRNQCPKQERKPMYKQYDRNYINRNRFKGDGNKDIIWNDDVRLPSTGSKKYAYKSSFTPPEVNSSKETSRLAKDQTIVQKQLGKVSSHAGVEYITAKENEFEIPVNPQNTNTLILTYVASNSVTKRKANTGAAFNTANKCETHFNTKNPCKNSNDIRNKMQNEDKRVLSSDLRENQKLKRTSKRLENNNYNDRIMFEERSRGVAEISQGNIEFERNSHSKDSKLTQESVKNAASSGTRNNSIKLENHNDSTCSFSYSKGECQSCSFRETCCRSVKCKNADDKVLTEDNGRSHCVLDNANVLSSKVAAGVPLRKEEDVNSLEVSSTVHVNDSFSSNRKLLVQYGKEISDLILCSHFAVEDLLSLYREWSDKREQTLCLFKALIKNVSETVKANGNHQAIFSTIETSAKIASVVPLPYMSIIATIVTMISKITSQIMSSYKPTIKVLDIDETEVSVSLQEDLNLSSDLYRHCLMCDEHFKKTIRLIEEFHQSIANGNYSSLKEMSGFLDEITQFSPEHHVYLKRLKKALGKLSKADQSDVSHAFCGLFVDYPLAMNLVENLDWCFRIDGFNPDSLSRGWQEISLLLLNYDSSSFDQIFIKIQNCLQILLSEQNNMKRNIAKFLHS